MIGEGAPGLEGCEVLVAAAVEQRDPQARGAECPRDPRHVREVGLVLEDLAGRRQLDEEPGVAELALDPVEVVGLRGVELPDVQLAAVGGERAAEVDQLLGGQADRPRATDQVAPALKTDGERGEGDPVGAVGGERRARPDCQGERRAPQHAQDVATRLSHGRAPP